MTVGLEQPWSPFGADIGEQGPEDEAIRWVWCVIRPESLDAVTQALIDREIGGMTLTEVRGFGRQKGQTEHYRGESYVVRLLPKIRIDLAVRREDVELVVAAISRAARTGAIGDGKTFVLAIENAVRIRTGERGMQAI